MKEKLDNKIVVVELAGRNILLNNSSDNFNKELIAMGFVKNGKYYALGLPTNDVTKRVTLIKKLIALGDIFSDGKDWSPSELVDYYKEIGLIDSTYYKISWKGKDDFYIVLK